MRTKSRSLESVCPQKTFGGIEIYTLTKNPPPLKLNMEEETLWLGNFFYYLLKVLDNFVTPGANESLNSFLLLSRKLNESWMDLQEAPKHRAKTTKKWLKKKKIL